MAEVVSHVNEMAEQKTDRSDLTAVTWFMVLLLRNLCHLCIRKLLQILGPLAWWHGPAAVYEAPTTLGRAVDGTRPAAGRWTPADGQLLLEIDRT